MLSKTEIQQSIEALQPAPAGETIQQCGYRVARWLLSDIEDAKWEHNSSALALALAVVRVRARALAFDLDRVAIKILGDRLEPTPSLDGAIFERLNAGGGALSMSTWHQCSTTHCRAGWAITVNPAGAELERVFGPEWAGRLIYLKSTGRVPNFFASNNEAMADIRKCAAQQ
jgi:hypothetical protein